MVLPFLEMVAILILTMFRILYPLPKLLLLLKIRN